MKLKLIDFRQLCLIGALILPNGAWAADAVVSADPEPEDYVKVCDAYGNGYFYIPGTATCLRIRGLLRYEKEVFNYSRNGAGVKQSIQDFDEGQLEIYARNDSEYGMVYAWIKLDNITSVLGQRKIKADDSRSWVLSETSTNDNRYLFGIGNFEAGLNNSQFSTFFGDGGATDWAGHYINLDYKVRQQVSYSFYDDYLSAIISLESGSKPHRAIPDVVAAAKYDFGDYDVSGGFGYDKPDNSFAWTGRFDAQVTNFRFILQAFYSDDINNTYFDYDGLSVLGGASVKITDKVSLAADLQYWDNGDWLGIADASFSPVKGFRLLGELSSGKIEQVKSNSMMFRVERSF